MKINGRMKQRLERLEAERRTTELPLDCVLLTPMQDPRKEVHAQVVRTIKERCVLAEKPHTGEMQRRDPANLQSLAQGLWGAED